MSVEININNDVVEINEVNEVVQIVITSGTGTVTSVGLSSATSGVTIGSTPVTTSGTLTLSIATATTSQNGLLSSADFTTFNNKQSTISLTTTGTSGAATFSANTLNIPQYSGTNIYNTDGTLSTTTRIISYNVSGASYQNKLILRNLTVLGGANDDFIFQATNNNPPIFQIWNPNYGGQLSFGGNGIVSFGGGRLNLSTSAHPICIFPSGVESARFHANGNVAIGTTTDAGFKLDVNGTARILTINAININANAVIGSYANFSGNAAFGTTKIAIGGNGGFGDGAAYWLEIVSNSFTINGNSSIEFSGAIFSSMSYSGTFNALSRNNAVMNFSAGLTTYYNQYTSILNATGNAFANTMYVRGYFVNSGTIISNSTTIIPIGFENVSGSNLFNSTSGSTLFGGQFGSLNASAQVQIDSTTKGFLPPRMTTTERNAIVTPATGLQVYNTTTNNNNVYNGTAWVGEQSTISLTTTGTSGAATFSANTLNIPQYSGTNIYNANGSLTSARELTLNAFNLDFIGSTHTNRITAAGCLLLGTVSESTFLLDVNGTARVSGDMTINGVLLDTTTTNRQTASYSLVLADRGKLVEMNSASANTLTIPLNSSIAFPIGSKIDVAQYGAGQTTIVATGGVTIRSTNGWLKLNAKYAAATLIKIATDEWYLIGNLNA